jgi:hypothetical protein
MCHGMLIETEAVERRRPAASRFGGEPELCELLRDPIARALMAADKVESGDVYALLRKTRGNAASRDSAC